MTPLKHTNPWAEAEAEAKAEAKAGAMTMAMAMAMAMASSDVAPTLKFKGCSFPYQAEDRWAVTTMPSSFVAEVESSPKSLKANLRGLEQDCRDLDTSLKEINRKLSAISSRLEQPECYTDGYYQSLEILIKEVNDSLRDDSRLSKFIQLNSSHLAHLKQHVKKANDQIRQDDLLTFRRQLTDAILARYDASFTAAHAGFARGIHRMVGSTSSDEQNEGRDYCFGFVENYLNDNPGVTDLDSILNGLMEKLQVDAPLLNDPSGLKKPIKRRFDVVNAVLEEKFEAQPAHGPAHQSNELYDLSPCQRSLDSVKNVFKQYQVQAQDLKSQWSQQQRVLHDQGGQQKDPPNAPSRHDDNTPVDLPSKWTSFTFRVISFMAFCMVCVTSCFRRSHPVASEQEQEQEQEQVISPPQGAASRSQRRCCPGLFSCLFRRNHSPVQQGSQSNKSDYSPD